MFDELAGAVGGLEIPLYGDALAAVLRIADQLNARIAAAVDDFDRTGGWEIEGATSITAWLRDRGGVARPQAGQLLRTGRRFRDLPVLSAAARDGVLSGGQVQAVVSTVTEATVPVFAEQEAELVPKLAELGPADLVSVLGRWQAQAETAVGAYDGLPEEPDRSLYLSRTFQDRWEGSFSLDGESGAWVDKAIQEASTRDRDGDRLRLAAERRADALVDVCRWFLEHRDRASGSRHRPSLNLLVTVDDQHQLSGGVVGGPQLDPATLGRLACDCVLHKVVLGADGGLLRFGRSTRTVPVGLWNALVVRDLHCRFPGCDRPAHWSEAHHAVAWDEGGLTDAENLVLLCSRHHHRLHRPGWKAKLRPDASLEVTSPEGTTRVTRPPGELQLPIRPPPLPTG
jgi:hypothetical protein